MGQIKINNTKGFEVGDIVRHERGWIGRVQEIEYCEENEVRVEWWGREANTVTPRTSIKFLSHIMNSIEDEIKK